MITTQYINLNMKPSGVLPVLYCSQYDIGRPLGMVVYNGSETVDLDSYTVTIEATRTDGTAITSAVTTDGNIGAFATTATMTNQADRYLAKLVLFDSNSRRVASLAFAMCVTAATMDENAESIEEDASLYQQYTKAVQSTIASIRADLVEESIARQTSVAEEASTRQEADNNLQSAINAEASTRSTHDAALQSQIDQLVAPTGQAPSAAEVQNIRVDVNGNVYTSAGDAVRGQVNDLRETIENTSGNTIGAFLPGYFDIPDVGNVVSATRISSAEAISAEFAVIEGDVVHLQTAGGGSSTAGARGMAWLDSDRKVISRSGMNKTYVDETFMVPPDAAYIVLNHKVNNTSVTPYVYLGAYDREKAKSIDSLDTESNYNNYLVNYDYDKYCELKPSGTTGSTAIGIKRELNVFTLNTSSSPSAGVRIKLNGNMKRFSSGSPSEFLSLTGITLKTGHAYRIKSIHLSGTSNLTFPNAVSVVEEGTYGSIGKSWVDGDVYYRDFIYGETPVSILYSIEAGATFTDYKVMILLEDMTELANRYDVFALLDTTTGLWEQGTYTTAGEEHTNGKRIRTPGYITCAGGFCSVDANSGYEFAVQAFDEDMTFLGLLQIDGSFAADATNMALFTSFSFDRKPAWKKYRFHLIGKRADDATMTPDEGVNFIFTKFAQNKDTVNVKDFGAIGNGTTDDYKAIQYALNQGGTVYIPDGTYLINTSLVIYSNTHLILSPKATLLRGANIRCLIHSYCEADTTGYNGEHDITIEGGTLDLGTGFTQGASCVAFIHAQNIVVRSCIMKHMNVGFHFCDIAGCKNVLIENCVFTDALSTEYTACFIQVDCPWGRITYTYDGFADGSACFDSTPCVQYVVRGCTFYLNDYSPAFGNHNDGLNKYIEFSGNYVYGGHSTRGAIAFADYTDHNYTDIILIHDNVFSGCDYGFKFMNDGTGRAYIRNNVFENIGTLQVNPNSPVGHFSDNIEITTA